MQHNKDVDHHNVKIYYSTDQFPILQFLGPHNKPHGVHVLSNHYHMIFDPKLGHGTCAISCIPFSCTFCTSIIYQPWFPGFPLHKQPCYQPVQYFT